MRRAKIVCTIGPGHVVARADPGARRRRAWTSRGSTSATATTTCTSSVYRNVRAAARRRRAARSAILVDLQGPKIRLGRFARRPA